MARLPRAVLLAGLVLGIVDNRATAADLTHARAVVRIVYDTGLYESELDRAMAQADGNGVFGGRGSTAATRFRTRAATRSNMLAQREAVIRLAGEKVAARATDPQLDAILSMAASPDAKPDPALLDGGVAAVKAGFSDALWDQLARVARGSAEFPCTKQAQFRCN